MSKKMSKKKIAIAASALVAFVGLGGGTYAVSAFTDHSLAAPAANQSTVGIAETTAATTATDPQATQESRAQILDMLEDHMGLTGPEADTLATTMAELMQDNGGRNVSDMVKQCAETAGHMMGAGNMMGNSQMMDGATPSPSGTSSSTGTHESHHALSS